MVVVIEDPLVAVRYIQERRRTGRDHHDEVWEGVYLVSPDPNNEHQSLTVRFGRCALVSIEDEGLGRVFTGGNVSDQAEDWTTNFRCPDIAVYLEGGIAKDMGSHWLMGPDFAVEIVSRGDRSRDKFDFYAAVGTRELLIVDRYPWASNCTGSKPGRSSWSANPPSRSRPSWLASCSRSHSN